MQDRLARADVPTELTWNLEDLFGSAAQWEAELEALDVAIKQEVEEAVKFAEDSPLPGPEALYEDVYKTPDYPFIKD